MAHLSIMIIIWIACCILSYMIHKKLWLRMWKEWTTWDRKFVIFCSVVFPAINIIICILVYFLIVDDKKDDIKAKW